MTELVQAPGGWGEMPAYGADRAQGISELVATFLNNLNTPGTHAERTVILSPLTATDISTEEPMRSQVLTLVALLGVVTMLGGCRHRPGHDVEEIHKYVSWRVDDVLDDIDATAEQREVVDGAKERLFETAKKHRADKDRDALAMLAEWQSDEPDADVIRALIDKKLEQHRAFAYQAADEAIAIHRALEPEQRAELAEMIKEHLADH